MTASYTCLACAEPIQPGNAVIVGIDLAPFPAAPPVNVVAHKGCEDRARTLIAKALEAREKRDGRF